MPEHLEIVKFTKRVLKVYNMKPIRTDWCMTPEDLYRGTNPGKWNITWKFAKEHHAEQQYEYCSKVFLYFLQLALNDIIDNGITLEVPCVGKKEARIYVKCFSDEEFTELYKRGVFKGIDYICSEFKGYHLMFQWKYKNKIKEKPIYIDKTLKEKFYNYINNGKQYY